MGELLEAARQAEIEEHFDHEESCKGNRKNCYSLKQLKTSDWTFELAMPVIETENLSRRQCVKVKPSLQRV
jgi:transposase-like protein